MYLCQVIRKQTDMKKLIFLVIIGFVLVLAAVRNPSEREAKESIKAEATKLINEKITEESKDNDIEDLGKIGVALSNLLAPTIMDHALDIDVKDYIFCSSFAVTTKVSGEKKNIASGIILFGKIIPLSSDFKNDRE